MSSYIKKNGLLYSEDLHTVLGVDDTVPDFTGRVPFGAHKIDDEVFSDSPYESISLPDSVTELGASLFANSKSLEKVKLPSGLTELPANLFAGCSALTKVTMPNSVSSFPEGLFKNCESLPEIPFRAGITSLSVSVFEGCKSLKSLVIPPTVRRIESRAVAGCSSLESVVFPACLEYLAPDAFEGCSSLRNLRVDGDTGLFYIGEEDGCLYEAADEGDRIVLRVNGVPGQSVSFYKDDAEEISAGFAEVDDEDFEEDDTFSAEIGASAEEAEFMQVKEHSESSGPAAFAAEDKFENNPPEPVFEKPQVKENSAVDSMLADIMGEEKERAAVSEEIGVSEKETEVLSQAMSVMSDSSMGNDAAVSNDELEKLFSKNEEAELATHNADNPDVLDSKAQILTDSVGLSTIIECEPNGQLPDEPELFVIAEKLAKDESGKNNFSAKLVACCKYFAKIQDYKRVIMLYGLPLDNDEFTEFFKYFISKKNVILACEAESPSTLSDFGKTICDYARISLKKEELAQQRRSALEKTRTLVKLVIRDKYV
jgi:hypothetical protein